MKKLMCLVVMLQICITMFGQATDLVVTTERVGQLPQLISETDQATVKNLKVIGKINSNDLSFIGSLINKKLKGTIDLSDAIIKEINGSSPFGLTTPADGICPIIKKVVLPKSLEKITGGYDWFSGNYHQLDTLEFDSQVKTVLQPITGVRHLVLGEKVDSIMLPIGGLIESIEIKSYPRYLRGFVNDYHNRFILSEENLKHLVNVEYIGERAFGGGSECLGKRVLSEIDTLCFPNIRSFHFNSFTYHSGLHVYLGPNLQELYSNSNPYQYSADGVTFHIAAKKAPKCDYGDYWMKGDYKIMVPKESVDEYIESGWPNIYAEPVPLTAIDIKPTNVVMEVGETIQLIATPIPANADDVDFVWESSNEEEVKVSDTGVITAIKSGEVQITVSSRDGLIKSTVKIVVATHVTGIMLSQENCQLNELGDSIQLEATVLPENATNKDVIWTSSNEAVCVVASGKVIATGFGAAVVKATTLDGNYSALCFVRVYQHVETVWLNKPSISLKVGEKEQLIATVIPDNVANRTIVWSSSDNEIATVDDKGNVTAVKVGETWIFATSEDNPQAKDSCNVIVPDIPAPAPNGECATPTINVSGNKMTFECETPDAEFTSYLTISEEFSGGEVVIENRDITFTLTVYAIAPGYDRSKPATMKFTVKKSDVNGDGHIDVADIATIISEMAARARMQEETEE